MSNIAHFLSTAVSHEKRLKGKVVREGKGSESTYLVNSHSLPFGVVSKEPKQRVG